MLKNLFHLITEFLKLAYAQRHILTMYDWEEIAEDIATTTQAEQEQILHEHIEYLDTHQYGHKQIIQILDDWLNELENPVTQERAEEINKEIRILRIASATLSSRPLQEQFAHKA